MKKPKAGRAWYFIDEAGDPNFYGKGNRLIVGEPGCSRIFLLGFVELMAANIPSLRASQNRL